MIKLRWVAGAALLTAVTAAAPAAAAAHPSRLARAAALDWCPGTASLCRDSRAIETLAKGAEVRLRCSTAGRGGTWFYARATGGKRGWLPAADVKTGGSAPGCAASRAVTAALWTTRADVWDKVHPTSAMTAKLDRVYGTDYDFGTSDDWSGDSRAFGALAYLANGGKYKLPLTNPIDTYKTYQAEGKVHTAGTPPIGALVFWHHVSYGYEYGLLGISLGNGQAAVPPGFDASALPVTRQTTHGNMGWVLPF